LLVTATVAPREPLPTPYVVTIDDREKLPYAFGSVLRGDRRRDYRIVTARGRLDTGDYAIRGHESAIVLERKSAADLYGTLGHGRRRFVQEMERFSAIDLGVIIVERELAPLITDPPPFSRLAPASVFQTVISWTVRYTRVRWFFAPDRAWGEVTAARLIDWYYRERIAVRNR
jgi:ERCC4-type nuclease